jgi:hypothetical protein
MAVAESNPERATSSRAAARRPYGTESKQKKGRKKEYWNLPFFRSSVNGQTPTDVAANAQFGILVNGLCSRPAAVRISGERKPDSAFCR